MVVGSATPAFAATTPAFPPATLLHPSIQPWLQREDKEAKHSEPKQSLQSVDDRAKLDGGLKLLHLYLQNMHLLLLPCLLLLLLLLIN